MQNILSIDISGNIATALICAVEGNNISVIERAHTRNMVSCLLEDEKDTQSEEENDEGEVLPEDKLADCIYNLVSKLSAPYTNVIVIAPTLPYLSLNLDLPFNTPKNINKVLDFEIQDATPLEPTDFLIYPKAVAKNDSGDFDVHVSLIPKDLLGQILRACRKADIEPYIITTVTSAIAAAYLLAPTPLSENSIFIHAKDDFIALAAVINGAIRFDRILSYKTASDADFSSDWTKTIMATPHPVVSEEALQNLKLTIRSLEEKFQISFANAYLFGDYLSDLGSLELKILNMPALIHGATNDDIIPAMASVFGEDYDAPKPLANFRTGEFRYHYQLKELFKGLRGLIPLVSILLILIVAFTYVVYQARENKITKIQNELKAEIAKYIPASSDYSIEEISKISDSLEKELNSLGMSSVVSPMEAFVLISEDINSVKRTNQDIDITKIDLTQNNAVILVTAPNYNDLDTMKSVLNQRKNIYCSVKFNQKSSHPKRQGEFILDFCKK